MCVCVFLQNLRLPFICLFIYCVSKRGKKYALDELTVLKVKVCSFNFISNTIWVKVYLQTRLYIQNWFLSRATRLTYYFSIYIYIYSKIMIYVFGLWTSMSYCHIFVNLCKHVRPISMSSAHQVKHPTLSFFLSFFSFFFSLFFLSFFFTLAFFALIFFSFFLSFSR